MPDAPGLELIRGEIEQDHPGAIVDTSFDRDQPALVVDPTQILAVLTWLREAPGQEYRFLSSLHAADYLPASPRFAVHYELLNRDRVERRTVLRRRERPEWGTSQPSRRSRPCRGEIVARRCATRRGQLRRVATAFQDVSDGTGFGDRHMLKKTIMVERGT